MSNLYDLSSFPKQLQPFPLLKPKATQSNQGISSSSLVKDKAAHEGSLVHVLPPAMMNPFEAMNYLRPSNQLILLLQKGTDFPVYPPELAERVSVPPLSLFQTLALADAVSRSVATCLQIDDRTWYKRMKELERALGRYWSWVEKALFAFAFIASVTVVSDFGYEENYKGLWSPLSSTLSSTQPWPIISAVSHAVQPEGDIIYEEGGEEGDIISSTTSAVASAATSAIDKLTGLPSSTITSAARAAATTAANPVRRQVNTAQETDSDLYDDYYSDDAHGWPGHENWADGYSSGARWAAIGILVGVVIAVWLPWFIVTMRVR